MHKIVSGYAPSNSHKFIAPRPRLDLFKCSLMYSGGNLWNNLPLSIIILSDHKTLFV